VKTYDKLRHTVCFRVAAPVALLFALAAFLLAQDPRGEPRTGESMYRQSCATCHDGGVAGRRAIAEFVTGKKLGTDPPVTALPLAARCQPGPDDFTNPLSAPRWNGWGPNTTNSGFQDSAMAGLTADQIPRLKLKWAFGYPGDIMATANGAPTVVGGRVFVAGPNGSVFSLSAATGCVRWSLETGSRVRTASVSADSTPIPVLSMPPFLGTPAPRLGLLTPLPASSYGKPKSTILRARELPALRCSIKANFTFRFAATMKFPLSSPHSNAAVSAAVWCAQCGYRKATLENMDHRRGGQADYKE
jgi:PQQ-like domain